MYLCTYKLIYTFIAHTYIQTYRHTDIQTYIYMYSYICIYLHTNICVHAHTYIYILKARKLDSRRTISIKW